MLAFFGAVRQAPRVQWMQISWNGIKAPLLRNVLHKPHFIITDVGTDIGPNRTNVIDPMQIFMANLHLFSTDRPMRHQVWVSLDMKMHLQLMCRQQPSSL